MYEQGSQELDLSCVAQSALAVITGKAQAYYQEHPNLHDVAAIGHLAEKAGLFVAVMPVLQPGKDGMPTDKIKDGKDRYPIIMAHDPQLGLELVEKYLKQKAKGSPDPDRYDLSKVKLMKGDLSEIGFAELKAQWEKAAEKPQGLDTSAEVNVDVLREPQVRKKA